MWCCAHFTYSGTPAVQTASCVPVCLLLYLDVYLASSAAQYTVLFTPWALFYLCGWGGLFPRCFPGDSLADTCGGEAWCCKTILGIPPLPLELCMNTRPYLNILLVSDRVWHQRGGLVRNVKRYTCAICMFLRLSQPAIHSKLKCWVICEAHSRWMEWDHSNNDVRVRISLCSCAVRRYAQICLGCLSGRGTRRIPAHRSSCCRRK